MKKKIIIIRKFSPIHFSYVFSVAIFAFIFMILILTLFKIEAIHFGALGSSVFAALCFPTLQTSQTRHLIGSYAIAIFIGMLCSYLNSIPTINNLSWNIALLGSLSVGITIGVLILLSLEHPPSAGVALGFIITRWDWQAPIILFGSIIFLALYRWIITKYLPFYKGKKIE